MIALDDLGEYLVKGLGRAALLQLKEAPLRPDLRRGSQINLYIRIRQYNGADVASVHDNALLSGKSALRLQQIVAHTGNCRNGGGVHRDLRQSDLIGDIRPVEHHMLQPVVLTVSNADLQLRQHRKNGGFVLRGDPTLPCSIADGTIDRAGINVSNPQLGRDCLGQCAFSGAGWSVNGDRIAFFHAKIAPNLC